jgi:hypothetical protein
MLARECVSCERSFEREDFSFSPDDIAICRFCLAQVNPADDKAQACPNDGTIMS